MKVATFLLSLITSDTPATNGTVNLTLPLSRLEISEVLELSPETISRTLSSFRREQLVMARGRHLVIQNRAALESAAHRSGGFRTAGQVGRVEVPPFHHPRSILLESVNWRTPSRLRQHFLHHVAMHVGEPEVASLEFEG